MSLIFLATEWGATKGGINALNYDLCIALALENRSPRCLVPMASASDIVYANTQGVRLFSLGLKSGEFEQHSAFAIKELLGETLPNNCIWVGHDVKTGGLASDCKATLGGTCVVLHHMDYSNYYAHLDRINVAERIDQQKEVISQADIVFGVGPRLTSSAKRIRGPHAETYEIMPGLHAPLQRPDSPDFRIALAGRLSRKTDPIKNTATGLKAAAKFLGDVDGGRGAINLIGASPQEVQQVREAESVAVGVALNAFAHISNRSAYFARLAESDVLAMPSLKEGFGLVAWEALCLEIPVIVSESSGFYEFIKSKNLLNLITSVKISGDKSDENRLELSFKSVFGDYGSKAVAAKTLRDSLSDYTWANAARHLLSFLPESIDNIEAKLHLASEDAELLPVPPALEKIHPSSSAKYFATQAYAFPRFEDLLKINYKQRHALVSADEGTSFSEGKRIKFELWVSPLPNPTYFLFLFPSANISQTISKAIDFLTGKKIKASNITILRKDRGEQDFIKKIFESRKYSTDLNEYTFKEYIWEFCVDEQFKSSAPIDEITHYIDQSILVYEDEKQVQYESAKNFFQKVLIEKTGPAAHIIIAPGGMGKTSLCLSLVSDILRDKKSSASAVLIQAETLRDYYSERGHAHLMIESVYDLYEAHSKTLRQPNTQDRLTFELAVLCGNIVVVVDGLDELLSFFQERFDLKQFLSSLEVLHGELGASQVILTTRDGSIIKDNLSSFNVSHYELLGFDEKDWRTYAKRRFHGKKDSDEISNKLFEQLEVVKSWDDQGRVVPFFADVVSNVLEEEYKDGQDSSFKILFDEIPYASNCDLTDHIVFSVFRREKRRHAIDVEITDLVEIISHAVAEHGSFVSEENLTDALSLLYDSRSLSLFKKIAINPLFVGSEKGIKVKYEFLTNYFRGLFLIDSIVRATQGDVFFTNLARLNGPSSIEIAAVEKYFLKRVALLHDCTKKLVNVLGIQSGKDGDARATETARRAISSLFKLYASVRNMSGARLREQLLDLLGATKHGTRWIVDGIYFFGDGPVLDFSNLTVTNSQFVDFKRFTSSKLTNAEFMYCVFERCATQQVFNSTILTAKFDKTCDLGDLKPLIDEAAERGESSTGIAEEDILKFLSSFFDKGFPYDPKLDWVRFSNRLPGLRRETFPKLIPKYFVVKTKKSDETYYQLAPDFIESARRFISNNYLDGKMKKFFKEVA